MKKFCITLLFLAALLNQVLAQQKLEGQVRDKTSGAALADVTVSSSGRATRTDASGHFSLTVPALPTRLVVTSAEYDSLVLVAAANQLGALDLAPKMLTEQEVLVTSSTRMPTRLRNAPVTIERYGYRQIANAPTDYYSLAVYRKGVDITTSSLTFKTISTRGFNGSGSPRVNQLVDGMDNQAPGLNFFVGNFAGLTELDVDHVEILPGASSALYGPGGMNGTILINSKSPFEHQGLSLQLKQGVNHIDARDGRSPAPLYDYALRYAKSFNRFAFKVSGQYLQAQDWLADNQSNYRRTGSGGAVIPGSRATAKDYDGVNVYGDETSGDIRGVLQAMMLGNNALAPVLSPLMVTPQVVSRTGYSERDMIDPNTKNLKLTGALHYRLGGNTEAILSGNWARGNTVYTGNNRFVLKGITIAQYKAELRNKNWFLRAFTTQEDAGDAYSATTTAQLMNEGWKRSLDTGNLAGSWFPQYTGALVQQLVPVYTKALGDALAAGKPAAEARTAAEQAVLAANSGAALHNAARAFADVGRPQPGSPAFRQLFDQVRKVPIPRGGLFLEKSQLWMYEGQYHFKNLARFADLVVGGNFKRYVLNSQGTIFIDSVAPIRINELGLYAQLSKPVLPNDALTLSVSLRYDKNQDFEGRYTPRATALLKLAPEQTLRFSYQTAYRFATTQQKFIRLDVGDYTILGGLPWIMEYMNAAKFPLVDLITQQPFTYRQLEPESMRSFELGYRATLARRLSVDAYAYAGQYRNFLGRRTLYQPASREIYSVVVNIAPEVRTYGFGASFDYRLPHNFSVFANAYSDRLSDVPADFQSLFNTPKYRLNAGVGNTGLGKKERWGFNLLYRWRDAFSWQGELAYGPVPAFNTMDAQVNYRFPKIKSIIKLGGTNITNRYYIEGYANPRIGAMYYLSVGYNVL